MPQSPPVMHRTTVARKFCPFIALLMSGVPLFDDDRRRPPATLRTWHSSRWVVVEVAADTNLPRERLFV
jgi:hypothetical protein